jgi:hypothetical protein
MVDVRGRAAPAPEEPVIAEEPVAPDTRVHYSSGEYNEYSTANRENLLVVADCCNPDPVHNAQMDAEIAESLELYNIQIELGRSALLPAPPYSP